MNYLSLSVCSSRSLGRYLQCSPSRDAGASPDLLVVSIPVITTCYCRCLYARSPSASSSALMGVRTLEIYPAKRTLSICSDPRAPPRAPCPITAPRTAGGIFKLLSDQVRSRRRRRIRAGGCIPAHDGSWMYLISGDRERCNHTRHGVISSLSSDDGGAEIVRMIDMSVRYSTKEEENHGIALARGEYWRYRQSGLNSHLFTYIKIMLYYNICMITATQDQQPSYRRRSAGSMICYC